MAYAALTPEENDLTWLSTWSQESALLKFDFLEKETGFSSFFIQNYFYWKFENSKIVFERLSKLSRVEINNFDRKLQRQEIFPD